jgi:hypothetical protein
MRAAGYRDLLLGSGVEREIAGEVGDLRLLLIARHTFEVGERGLYARVLLEHLRQLRLEGVGQGEHLSHFRPDPARGHVGQEAERGHRDSLLADEVIVQHPRDGLGRVAERTAELGGLGELRVQLLVLVAQGLWDRERHGFLSFFWPSGRPHRGLVRAELQPRRSCALTGVAPDEDDPRGPEVRHVREQEVFGLDGLSCHTARMARATEK